MIVGDPRTGHVYEPVMDGVCGFANLKVYPANSSFAHWLKKHVGARSAYGGGLYVPLPVGRSSQSYTRKDAAATEMARHLRENIVKVDPNVRVYAESRLD
jgi:hypothetical protein